MICHSAGCEESDDPKFNELQPMCGNQLVCKACENPAGNSGKICYLTRADPDSVNVIEGSLQSENNHLKHHDSGNSQHHYNEEDEDEDDYASFLQFDNDDMKFVPSTADSTIKTNAASCALDESRNLDVSVRVIIQWYKVPGMKPPKKASDSHHEEGAMLDLSPMSYVQIGDKISHWDPHMPSFLGLFPKFKKIKNVFSSRKNSDDEEPEDYDQEEPSNGKKKGFFQKGKDLFRSVSEKLKQPTIDVNFAVSDQTITYCRQTQRWSGEMKGKSLVYTAVQNIKVLPSQMTGDFFKQAIRVHAICKDCEVVKYLSCVQILCRKKQPVVRNLGLPPNPLVGNSGIMQTTTQMATDIPLAATTAMVQHQQSTVPNTVPRTVYSNDAMVAHYMPQQVAHGMYVTSSILGMLAIAFCVIDI